MKILPEYGSKYLHTYLLKNWLDLLIGLLFYLLISIMKKSNISCKNFSVEIIYLKYLVLLLGWKGQDYKQNQLDCSTRSTSTL